METIELRNMYVKKIAKCMNSLEKKFNLLKKMDDVIIQHGGSSSAVPVRGVQSDERKITEAKIATNINDISYQIHTNTVIFNKLKLKYQTLVESLEIERGKQHILEQNNTRLTLDNATKDIELVKKENDLKEALNNCGNFEKLYDDAIEALSEMLKQHNDALIVDYNQDKNDPKDKIDVTEDEIKKTADEYKQKKADEYKQKKADEYKQEKASKI